jgi:membrane protein implicated in regulation of membrane protease activity
VAYLLKLERKRSFLVIAAGVVIAGVIMVLLNFYPLWVGLIIIALMALALLAMGKFEEKVLGNSSGPGSHHKV